MSLDWSDEGLKERMRAGWAGGRNEGTACGSGSTREATAEVRKWVPEILAAYGIRDLCDAGAGDLSWIRETLPRHILYRAFDLVPRHPDVLPLDISREPLPLCDAILCRHVLIHLNPPRILRALQLFAGSSRYLLASQYPAAPPFDPSKQCNLTDLVPFLGAPLRSTPDTLYPDTFLALWRLWQ